jgi:hypothetical protein
MSIDASTSHKTQGPRSDPCRHKRIEALWIFMLDRPLALGLRLGSLAASSEDSAILIKPGRERKRIYARALFLSNTTEERVELLLDRRGIDLISDALPFGRLWYGELNAISNAIGVHHRRNLMQAKPLPLLRRCKRSHRY